MKFYEIVGLRPTKPWVVQAHGFFFAFFRQSTGFKKLMKTMTFAEKIFSFPQRKRILLDALQWLILLHLFLCMLL